MSETQVFSFKDPIDFLKALISEKKNERGFQRRLAEAGGCQPSYLSKALSGGCLLTPDHAAGIAEFIGLSPLETECFLELVNQHRASSRALKEVVTRRLALLRQEHQKISQRIKYPPPDQSQADYYAAWLYSAVHVLSGIAEFQCVNAIAKRLGTHEATVAEVCKQLAQWHLVTLKDETVKMARNSLHAPEDQISSFAHLRNWRQQAVDRSLFKHPDAIHFTGVYCLSHSDAEKLREKILKYISEISEVVGPSKEEQGVCINLDYFPL